MDTIKLYGINPESVVDGIGIRLAVFVQGCSHNCKECHNPDSHDHNKGYVESISNIISLDNPYTSGMTLSGGDPLYELNRESVYSLCDLYRSTYPNKNIWLYTGYTYDALIKLQDPYILKILKLIDVLIDGRFDIEKRSLKYKFIGSTNQRILKLSDGIPVQIYDNSLDDWIDFFIA